MQEKELLEEKEKLTQILQNKESECKRLEDEIELKNQIISDTIKTIDSIDKEQVEKKAKLFENLLEKSSIFSLEVNFTEKNY